MKNEPAPYTKSDQYSDPSFPVDEALGWSEFNSNERVYKMNGSYSWTRISTLSGITLAGSDGKFSINDIAQGYLGDCYFLSALSSVAEKHEDVAGIFDQTELNSEGMYSIWAWPKGKPTNIRLDDQILSSNASTLRPVFTKVSEDKSVWVPLLEKYWAKLNGNYAQIEGGWSTEGITQLMGSPGYWSNCNGCTAEQVYEKINSLDRENNYISVGSRSETCGQLGIVGGHAYSVHSAYKIKATDGSTQCLIHIRNPWASERYTGDYGRASSLLTDDVLAQLRDQGAPEHSLDRDYDGDFFMKCEDWNTAWSTLFVNSYNQGWYSTSVEGTDTAGSTQMELKFTNPKMQDVMVGGDVWH